MKATLTISCSQCSARSTFGCTRWSLGQIDLISFAARRADTWVRPATEFIVYGTFCFYWSIQALSGKPTVAPGEFLFLSGLACVPARLARFNFFEWDGSCENIRNIPGKSMSRTRATTQGRPYSRVASGDVNRLCRSCRRARGGQDRILSCCVRSLSWFGRNFVSICPGFCHDVAGPEGENIANGCEMFQWIPGEIRRRFRCS
ncbi:hypothetical protein Pan153_57830 [Gimesia panareensis]|uniref:Uncharacterized protein n=1 Tax=Gimesia panareensis TaxID=2527978 RepID=A0A518FXR1_9PLAN|nr:hypothetical protein Pan153_57830 [Gimesia panareensis]